MRKTRKYTDRSTSPNQTCATCQFFRLDQVDICGHCEILAGPVSAEGHCLSWAG
ncbi:MAG: high-potential iron-sulfur protein [Halioglobus sp.]|nr:high-potential iron-sulfur protein [Halioglobus sp.]